MKSWRRQNRYSHRLKCRYYLLQRPGKKKNRKSKVKEQVVIAKPVKTETVAAAPQTTEDNNTAELPNRSIARLLRPLGIAAALVIGAGAIWYFGMRNPAQEEKIAQNTETAPQNTDSPTSENRKLAANTATETVKPAAAPMPETSRKAHKDSLIARAAQLKEQEKAKRTGCACCLFHAGRNCRRAGCRPGETEVKEEAAEKRQRKTEDNMAAAKAATKTRRT